jgi:Ala-tRNA(Pro) deacylase
MTTEAYHKILSLLDGAGVAYERFEHEHVHSSKDAANIRGTSLEEAAKALVLETGAGKLIMCIVSGHRRIDLKRLKALIGEKSVSLAHPDKVLAATGCPVGSVPPFGNLFGLPVYADEDIFSREHVVFSAGSHYHSIRMRASDWKEVVRPQVADIGAQSS